MTTAQRAIVNRQIAKEGIPLELHCGEGYQYFIHDDPANNRFETRSVMVAYINSLTYAQWLSEARAAWKAMQKGWEQ